MYDIAFGMFTARDNWINVVTNVLVDVVTFKLDLFADLFMSDMPKVWMDCICIDLRWSQMI